METRKRRTWVDAIICHCRIRNLNKILWGLRWGTPRACCSHALCTRCEKAMARVRKRESSTWSSLRFNVQTFKFKYGGGKNGRNSAGVHQKGTEFVSCEPVTTFMWRRRSRCTRIAHALGRKTLWKFGNVQGEQLTTVSTISAAYRILQNR